MDIEVIGREIVGSALRVHTRLGPGMLESAYEACIQYELRKRSLKVRSQVALPARYESLELDIGYRLDLLVEEAVVIEPKTVRELANVHVAQLLSYLRAGDYRLGFLLNFHTARMKGGIRRVVNRL